MISTDMSKSFPTFAAQSSPDDIRITIAAAVGTIALALGTTHIIGRSVTKLKGSAAIGN